MTSDALRNLRVLAEFESEENSACGNGQRVMKPAHRPHSAINRCFGCYQRAEEIINDITVFIDKVMKWCYCLSMKATEHPIEALMRSRLDHEVTRTKAIDARMRELAPAYNEFLDLNDERRARKLRIERILALIGPWDWHSKDVDYTEREAQRIVGKLSSNASEFEEWRAHLPLWDAMREFLSHVPEARIAEMEEFFEHVGFSEGNRQAIESALKRHPKAFSIRRKKREKYLSLKGDYDAASTKAGRK